MKYTVIAQQLHDDCWFIRVPELGTNPDGLPTEARSFENVEPMARDLIAVYLDVPEDSFDVEVRTEPAAQPRTRVSRCSTHATGMVSVSVTKNSVAVLPVYTCHRSTFVIATSMTTRCTRKIS